MSVSPMSKHAGSVRAVATALAAAALALGACASAPEEDPALAYHEHISRWDGETESDLVTVWGVPSKTHTVAGGGRVIEYQKQSVGKPVCTTRFALNEAGHVVRWWFTGAQCRAPKND